tara:strand:- start:56 stop:565 length:510 start_codon:yes stop_codon:yes gene_type:complete
MNYAKIKDGAIDVYPYSFAQLRKDNASTSFPKDSLERDDIRSSFNVVEVKDVVRPSKIGWITTEEAPTFSGDVWSQNWSCTPKAASDVRDSEMEAVDMPLQDGYEAEHGEPVLDGDVWKQTWDMRVRTWLENRYEAYGDARDQIEFITENGLEAWQSNVAEIKAKYPKV